MTGLVSARSSIARTARRAPTYNSSLDPDGGGAFSGSVTYSYTENFAYTWQPDYPGDSPESTIFNIEGVARLNITTQGPDITFTVDGEGSGSANFGGPGISASVTIVDAVYTSATTGIGTCILASSDRTLSGTSGTFQVTYSASVTCTSELHSQLVMSRAPDIGTVKVKPRYPLDGIEITGIAPDPATAAQDVTVSYRAEMGGPQQASYKVTLLVWHTDFGWKELGTSAAFNNAGGFTHSGTLTATASDRESKKAWFVYAVRLFVTPPGEVERVTAGHRKIGYVKLQ